MFCICSLSIPSNFGIRAHLAKGPRFSDFKEVVAKLREVYEPIHEGRQLWTKEYTGKLHLCLYTCGSYGV